MVPLCEYLRMPAFTARDGLRLAYRVLGTGPELICLPGGPMRTAGYLGDLGGLSQRYRLIIPDPRGTGQSAVPADLTTCRCDRQVDDVEALRAHLGLDQMDLLGHSASANLAIRYAERHPDLVRRLLLITPSTRGVGLGATVAQRRQIVRLRHHEPWYPEVRATFERINAGDEHDEDWETIAPLYYGRWDGAAQAHYAAAEDEVNKAAAAAFGAEGAFDPDATRAALGRLGSPVLLLAGGLDPGTPPVVAAEYAAMFPDCELVIQSGAGHYPWLDNANAFSAEVCAFLSK
jgi:proline iminopeptidase